MSSRRVPTLVPVGSTIVSLVLLPIMINFATGGEPWAWPLVVLLSVTAVSLTVWELLRHRTRINRRVPDHPRNRPNALDHINQYLQQRLQNSLSEKVRIALKLDERPDAVIRLKNLRVQPVDGEEYRITGRVDIDAVFREMQESLLILGAPGAGKTTLLLELGQRLVAAARRDAGLPIPALVDLARWSSYIRMRRRVNTAAKGQDVFFEWLLRELQARYTIPPSVGRAWLMEGKLTLLLDGLDEVASADQNDCVQQLNQLQEVLGGPQLCVCSREEDYSRLSRQLHMQGAVTIKPLDRVQVLDYCRRSGGRLDQVKFALERDDELWGLLGSPLMLNVMALAYQGDATGVIVTGGGSSDQRRMIFDAYIVEVLARRRAPTAKYTPDQTIRCLTLQASLVPDDSLVRNVWSHGLPRPIRLKSGSPRVDGISFDRVLSATLATAMSGVAVAATLFLGVVGIVATVACVAIAVVPRIDQIDINRIDRSVNDAPLSWKVFGAVAGFTLGAVLVILGGQVATLQSMLSDDWRKPVFFLLVGVLATMIGKHGLIPLLLIVFLAWQLPYIGLSDELVLGYWIGLASGVSLGLIIDVHRRFRADVGNGQTCYRLVGLNSRASMAAIGIATLAWIVSGQQNLMAWSSLIGVCIGLLITPEFRYPNSARLPQLLSDRLTLSIVRIAMIVRGYWVLRWSRFLKYACDRSLLIEVNGEFQFVHSLVEDHFAQCDPDLLGARVRERMTQLAVNDPPAVRDANGA